MINKCKELGVNVALSEVWAKGGEGGKKLAEEVLRLTEESNDDFSFSYELEGSIEDKLNQIVRKIYGGNRVILTEQARKQAKELEALLDEEEHTFTAPLVSFVKYKTGAPDNFSKDLPNFWPGWCNPDYSQVAKEIKADPRWDEWVAKTQE